MLMEALEAEITDKVGRQLRPGRQTFIRLLCPATPSATKPGERERRALGMVVALVAPVLL